MQPPPQLALWVQYVQALAPTVVAIVAAVIAGYIALRQWWTAHDRLRLDVFDKRFAVYDATKNLVSAATLLGQTTPDELARFYDGIRGAEFLFDGETRDFVMRVGDLAARARMIRARLDRQPQHPEAGKLIDQEEDILSFLRDQAPHLEELFGRYLDMSKIGLLRGAGLFRNWRMMIWRGSNATRDTMGNRSERLEEIRFAKTQQWRVATAAITLLGAIFVVAHTLHSLATPEKVLGTVMVTLIAVAGSVFLLSLQNHLRRTRLEVDGKDTEAWLRSAEVVFTLVAIVIVSAVVVGYSLWRGEL